MQELGELVAGHKDWLMSRMFYYIKERGYLKYTSTLLAAWRISTSDIVDTFLAAVQSPDLIPPVHPEDDYTRDPAALAGKVEARRYWSRGIRFEVLLGLLKYCRQSYLDLLDRGNLTRATAGPYRQLVELFFDRFELGFTSEWIKLSCSAGESQPADPVLGLADQDMYFAVFASLPDPAALIDPRGQAEGVNLAAARLLDGGAAGVAWDIASLLGPEVGEFIVSNRHEQRMVTQLPTPAGVRPYGLFLKRIPGPGGEDYTLAVWQGNGDKESSEAAAGAVAVEDVVPAESSSAAALSENSESWPERRGTLAALLQASTQGIVSLDSTGRINGWNAAMEQLLGWTAGEAKGRDYHFLESDEEAELAGLFQRVRAGESIREAEVGLRRKDGTLIPVSLTAVPLDRTDDNGPGVISLFSDHSRLRGLEAALQESNAKLLSIFGPDSEGGLRRIVIQVQ